MPPSYPPGFKKAELAIEGGETIPVLFNPTEYSITKTNTWNFKEVQGQSLPPPEFGGGAPRLLSLSLLLDASLLEGSQSVKDITDKLFKMMEVGDGQPAGGKRASPPKVTFRWGAVDTFLAVCTSLTVAYQLFEPNGVPIRADVKIDLKQAEPASTAARRARKGHQPDDPRRRPASASTPSRTATACRRSPTASTATRRAGARSPRPTASTTRCTLRRGTALIVPTLESG